jgi:hypothetical protein
LLSKRRRGKRTQTSKMTKMQSAVYLRRTGTDTV